MPELRCVDERTGKAILVERKTLSWPLDYIVQHESWHRFCEDVGLQLRPVLGTQPSMLSIQEPALIGRASREALARELVGAITESDIPRDGTWVTGQSPFPWALRFQSPMEREDFEPQEGLAIKTIAVPDHSIDDPRSAPADLREAVSKLLASAAIKFSSAGEDGAILLIQLLPASLGMQLTESWWAETLSGSTVPTEVDEVWIAENYDNDWEFTRGFNR